MKKLISLIIIALVLTMISASICFAEVSPGDTGTATFSVTSNPDKAIGASVKLTFDGNAFEYVKFNDSVEEEYSIADIGGNGFPDGRAWSWCSTGSCVSRQGREWCPL